MMVVGGGGGDRDGWCAGCSGMWQVGSGGKEIDDVAAFEPVLLDLECCGPYC